MRGGNNTNGNGSGNDKNVQDDVQHDNSNLLNSDTTDGQDGSNTIKGIDGLHGASSATPQSSARWNALRQRLRENAAKKGKGTINRKARVVGQMSVVTEMQTGILPVFMIKMSMERDEQGHRRIPVLLNHLHLRISDSVNPLHTSSAVFRIELEYGDGLIRWVCYRSLRDFINLHTHYRAAAIKGYLGRPVGSTEGDVGVPSFPKTSLPYFTQLQRQGWGKGAGDNGKARFAQAQRSALEDYLIEIIKRTMFRPEANRLCKFFELSTLSITLASRGGYQGKQGYLRILSRSSRKDAQGSLLTPVTWIKAHEPKWCIVRESYIAIVDQPDSTQVFDVFLLDNQFEIERPKRLYRQTLHLAQDFGHGNSNETSKSQQKEIPSHSAALDGKDETAILTEGHFRDPGDDEYSGSHRSKADAKVSSHTFHIKNAERKLKLVANNERQMNQFIASMERVARRNIFGRKNRFDSFAPIRLNCNARWIVDGRDYYWQVSRALSRAKDCVYIHDWWLSPELYLRRPGSPKYRLDNVLKRKAEEGVKVFVIVYNEVSNNFTPTDSNYTKQRLIGLHPNIFVQRSPSHFQTGTFYWAHHEKLCVIDETIAFMGGLDLCFGRWDTSSHVLTDNHLMENEDAKGSSPQPVGSMAHSANLMGPGAEGREFYVWPGQDFANERVVEWHDLTKPEVDLFDREHFPRMPWHDIGLQLIGQPARDLCRHFTQRWNLLLRIKNHKRLMPFLIPPSDFSPSDLKKFDLTGTCEAQICRSAGPWSMGTANTVEHSIQNAYLKSIQMSDHFVYIENQFFVTSTEARGTVIENMIGEALVSRIIRAEREKTSWKAIIVIPLIPGFPMPIDHPDASSVRLIVDLQYRSISRGEDSIFSKLRRRGIDPEQYISFFSLRQWGKLPSGRLTTEQVYIHAKAMIVDDRLAIIGSANINERSQRGDRDSELACVVRDTDMIDSTMAGKSYKVGRFAHTLRVRLMREHLGYDVDADEVQSDSGEKDDDNRQLFIDPLDSKFFKDLWVSSATHNTQIFRKVFRS
ncbi:phospholipase D, partial [Meira miltonrushii]